MNGFGQPPLTEQERRWLEAAQRRARRRTLLSWLAVLVVVAILGFYGGAHA